VRSNVHTIYLYGCTRAKMHYFKLICSARDAVINFLICFYGLQLVADAVMSQGKSRMRRTATVEQQVCENVSVHSINGHQGGTRGGETQFRIGAKQRTQQGKCSGMRRLNENPRRGCYGHPRVVTWAPHVVMWASSCGHALFWLVLPYRVNPLVAKIKLNRSGRCSRD